MTDPLRDLRITDESALQSFITDYFGPPIPGQPTGEQFLAQVSLGYLPLSGPSETIEDVFADLDPPASPD